MTEIERTYLVDELPVGVPEGGMIEQAYLAVDDGADVEVRVRRRSGACTLTVKRGSGVERDEVEIEIDDATFERLWAIAGNRTLRKTRSVLMLDSGDEAEVDVFHDALDGVRFVEVEFDDRASADRFEPPDWFGRDVTEERGWTNAELATRQGPPDDT